MSISTKQPIGMYYLVILHYLLAGVCFVILTLLLLFSVKELSGHYFNPNLLAITHLAALGWGTLTIFGACYQLLPVLLECNLYSNKLPWLTFALFVPGLFCLVYSFWTFEPGLHMQLGAILLTLSVATFCITMFKTAAKSITLSIHKDFISTSCIWLLATVILGSLLVFNFQYAFLPKDHLHFLKLHSHMGIAGWFLMLIVGVSSKLIPMFLVSKVQRQGLLTWTYYLINISLLLFIVDGYINGINSKTYFLVAITIIGLVTYMIYIKDCFKSRLKKKLDIPILKTAISTLMLGIAILVLPLIIYYLDKNSELSRHYTTFYGMLLFMGWISALIMGQAFKTLPFIVWVKKYEHLSGKVRIPMPADLYNHKLLLLQYMSYLAFCILFFSGYLIRSEQAVVTGVVCIIIASISYVANIIIVVAHTSRIKKNDGIS